MGQVTQVSPPSFSHAVISFVWNISYHLRALFGLSSIFIWFIRHGILYTNFGVSQHGQLRPTFAHTSATSNYAIFVFLLLLLIATFCPPMMMS
jgi:hypothetical protein